MICGIDVGTSSVKLSICNTEPATATVFSSCANTNANVLVDAEFKSEQSPDKILDVIRCLFKDSTLSSFSLEYIVFTGQMHGVMSWENDEFSNLVTWQDRRLTNNFLSDFPQIHPGFGLGTLLYENYGQESCTMFPGKFWGSIMDYLVWILQGKPSEYNVQTSAQIANSFGFFDPIQRCFDIATLEAAGFPVMLLPSIVSDIYVVGITVDNNSLGIPGGCKIVVPYGDTQTAFYSVVKNEMKTVINLGTSCQVGSVVKKPPNLKDLKGGLQYFPYFTSDYGLALNASMNGGNNVDVFVNGVLKPILDSIPGLSAADNLSTIYDTLVNSGLQELEREPKNDSFDSLNVAMWRGSLFPERSQISGSTSASLQGLTPDNCKLGGISLALHRGIIANAFKEFDESFDSGARKNKVVAVGSVFKKNKLFKAIVERWFPGCIMTEADSSLGAALFVRDNWNLFTEL